MNENLMFTKNYFTELLVENQEEIKWIGYFLIFFVLLFLVLNYVLNFFNFFINLDSRNRIQLISLYVYFISLAYFSHTSLEVFTFMLSIISTVHAVMTTSCCFGVLLLDSEIFSSQPMSV